MFKEHDSKPHLAMESLITWYLRQHPEDQHSVSEAFDKVNEIMWRIDRENYARELRDLEEENYER